MLVSQGQSMGYATRQIGVSEVTFYRWRQEYGGLKIDQVKRLKDLELENSRLRKPVSDLTLDKLILTEAAKEETSKPRASSRLHRSCPSELTGLRASRLCGARTASFDTAQGAAGPGGCRTAERRCRGACAPVWAVPSENLIHQIRSVRQNHCIIKFDACHGAR